MDGEPKYVIEKYLENENKNKKGIIYLTEQNRDFNTGALKISTIELQGEDGKSKNEFYFKEIITVKLTLLTKRNLKIVVFMS